MGMQICDHDTTVNVSSRSSVQKRHFFWMHGFTHLAVNLQLRIFITGKIF